VQILGFGEAHVGFATLIHDPKGTGINNPFLYTAVHVLTAARKETDGITVSLNGKAVEVPLKRIGLRYSKELDFCCIPVPLSLGAALGVRSMKVAKYKRNVPLAVYQTKEGEMLVSRSMSTPVRAFVVKYVASTISGSSGSPLIQNGKVVGIHLAGALKDGAVENEGVLWVPLVDPRVKESAGSYSSQEDDRTRADELKDADVKAVDRFYSESGELVERHYDISGSRYALASYEQVPWNRSWANDDLFEEITHEEYEEQHIGRMRESGSTKRPDFPVKREVVSVPASSKETSTTTPSSMTVQEQPKSGKPSESSKSSLTELDELRKEFQQLRELLQTAVTTSVVPQSRQTAQTEQVARPAQRRLENASAGPETENNSEPCGSVAAQESETSSEAPGSKRSKKKAKKKATQASPKEFTDSSTQVSIVGLGRTLTANPRDL
jgi:hypothetical protein